LRAQHSTKSGTWGLLHVLEGQIPYRLEPPRLGGRRLVAGDMVMIEPTIRHHVDFVERTVSGCDIFFHARFGILLATCGRLSWSQSL